MFVVCTDEMRNIYATLAGYSLVEYHVIFSAFNKFMLATFFINVMFQASVHVIERLAS